MRRAVAGGLTLAGLVLVVCAAMGFVLLGARGTWHAELRVPAGTGAVLVEPALASVIGPRLVASVRVDGAASTPMFVGRARPEDARALLAASDHLRVTGLSGGRRLDATPVRGRRPLPELPPLDIWQGEQVGAGGALMTYRAAPGALSLVLARADGRPMAASEVVLTWSNRAWYGFPAGLALVGLSLMVAARRWRRRSSPSPRALDDPFDDRSGRPAEASIDGWGSEPPGTDDPQTGDQPADEPAPPAEGLPTSRMELRALAQSRARRGSSRGRRR